MNGSKQRKMAMKVVAECMLDRQIHAYKHTTYVELRALGHFFFHKYFLSEHKRITNLSEVNICIDESYMPYHI